MAKETEDNSFGIASVILGVVSLSSFYMLYQPLAVAILGLILGIAERQRVKSRWSLCGIIVSGAGILLSIAWIIFAWYLNKSYQ